MEIASTVISVLKELYEIRETMLDNQAESIRLCDRCIALEKPVKTLMSEGKRKLDTKAELLQRLYGCLSDCKDFVDKYNEKTKWRFFTKVAFRNQYTDEICGLNTDLDRCIGDLQLGIHVDVEQRRCEDLEDTRKGFEASVQYIINNINDLSRQGICFSKIFHC